MSAQTPPARATDGMAIAAFVCGLCGLSLIPIVLGHVSLGRIRRDGLGGQGFAIVGLILGYLSLVATVVIVIAVVATVFWTVNTR